MLLCDFFFMIILDLYGFILCKIDLGCFLYIYNLQIWLQLNTHPKLKFFALIMPWNIKNLLLPSSYLIMEHLFKDFVLELYFKIGVQKENTNIFLIQLEFLISSSCHKIFWGKTVVIVVYTINIFPLMSLVVSLLLSVYVIVILTIICLKSLVVLVLFYFNLINTQN